jgi:hypothetical protein
MLRAGLKRCMRQHKRFNEHKQKWVGLYIPLDNGNANPDFA